MKYQGIQLRHEKKYYINYAQYILLRNKIKNCFQMDMNANPDGEYAVRSLYFDDIHNSALHEKNAGVFYRKKYRIRIYDKSYRMIRLEKKIKYGEYIGKVATVLTVEEYYAIMDRNNDEILINHRSELVKELYAEMKVNFLKPVIIIDYDREIYELKNLNIRVTFDKALSAGMNDLDVFSDNVNIYEVQESNKMILEIKYNEYLPSYVKSLLQLDSMEHLSISKYTLCRSKQDLLGGYVYDKY